ncbi:GntR family transcriptional regulator [Proteiniclasticum sp. C24MP]|uniref:GntR family transcriptional regulator n=1 Tax=Proteiniclasticum sp. C24MP TaxID=3374101 RepID=UPI00375445CB
MDEYMKEVIKLADLSQNKPLNEIVFEGLRIAIIKGIIPVGERINESVYAEKMNISRTPVREALRRIQEEGLVEYVPHYGVVVKKITIEDAVEIYQIRKALDILATQNAMKIMTEEQFDEMKALLERTDEADARGDYKEVIELSRQFNDMIYEFCRMPRLDVIVKKLRQYLMRFRDISLTENDRRRKALDEHWLLYQNMRQKNYEQVAIITSEHLDYSEKFILKEMRRIEEEVDEPDKEKDRSNGRKK